MWHPTPPTSMDGAQKSPNSVVPTTCVVNFSNNATAVVGVPPWPSTLRSRKLAYYRSFILPPCPPSPPSLSSVLLSGLRARLQIPSTWYCFLLTARTTTSAERAPPCGMIFECSTLAPTLSDRCHSTSRISAACVRKKLYPR